MRKHNRAKNTYTVEILEKKILIENEMLSSYGIKICKKDGKVDIYDDITFSLENINNLVALFSEYGIEESHIEETISDFVDMLHSDIA